MFPGQMTFPSSSLHLGLIGSAGPQSCEGGVASAQFNAPSDTSTSFNICPDSIHSRLRPNFLLCLSQISFLGVHLKTALNVTAHLLW